jgi:hypothetical protein
MILKNENSYFKKINNSLEIFILMFIFYIFSFYIFFQWEKNDLHDVTGDEPHYLLIADSIINYQSFDVTRSYLNELTNKVIYSPGLVINDEAPNLRRHLHVIQTENGLFSVHNIGLPLLIAIPFFLGKTTGVKIFLIILGGLLPFTLWKISSLFSKDSKIRFLSTLTVIISYPYINSFNQIYPDFLAGMITLLGYYVFIKIPDYKPNFKFYFIFAMVSFLPWLHIKFTLVSLLLFIGIFVKVYLSSNVKQMIVSLTMLSISGVLLILYNYYAFGNILGPYGQGALEFSKESLMVFWGLFLDQNHGFLFFNPIYFIGVYFLYSYYKKNPLNFWWLLLLIFSFLVPNALHTNWYGGWSFSGRFAWSGVTLFTVFTVFGLITISESSKRKFVFLISFSICIQAYYFWVYTFNNVELYNRIDRKFSTFYSIFFHPIQSFLPLLHNEKYAFSYLPNYGWLILLLLIFACGFFKTKEPLIRLFSKLSFLLALLLIIIPNIHKTEFPREVFIPPNRYSSQTGEFQNNNWIASQILDEEGFLVYGPYVQLNSGKYVLIVEYKSDAHHDEIIGYLDIFNASKSNLVKKLPINGTSSKIKKQKIEFSVTNWFGHVFELRCYWNGKSNTTIYNINLERIE